MTLADQVAEGQFGRAIMVENDVADARERFVAGHGNGGDRTGSFDMGVNSEDAFNATLFEQAWVFVDEVLAVAMVGSKEEVALAHEDVGGAGKDLGVVAVAELGEKDADGLGTLTLQKPRDHRGLVVELASSGADALAGGLRDGTIGRVVEDEGNGRRAEVEVLGEHLEADRAALFGGGFGHDVVGKYRGGMPGGGRYFGLCVERARAILGVYGRAARLPESPLRLSVCYPVSSLRKECRGRSRTEL